MKTVMTLKETCEFYNGTGFPTAYQGKTAGKYPFYKVGDISRNVQLGNSYLQECDNYVNDETLSQLRGVIVPANSIAFAKIGEALKLNRRTITSTPCLVDNNVIAIHPNEEILDVEYFYYFMKTVNMADYSSSTTVPSVKKSSLEKIVVPTPELNEQKRISSELNTLSVAIRSKKDELSSLDELVKSRFIEMFGHYFEDSRYFVKVGDIATATIGLTYKPDNVTDEGIIVLRSGNIQNAELCLSDDIVRVSNIKIKEDKFVRENDILMCSRNGSARLVGKCCLIPKLNEQMSYGAFMTVIRSKYPYFLNGFFNSTYFLQQLTGTQTASVNQITTGMLNGYTVIKPRETEENQFAEFVKLIDKSKFVCHSKNFLCDIFTFSSSTIAYPSVVSIFVCPKRC